MTDSEIVHVRVLPYGEFHRGVAPAWSGTVLHLTVENPSAVEELGLGSAVEVQSEGRLLLGTVVESRPPEVSIRVEHSLESSQMENIQRVWG
jgi:hypothetical protein